MSALAGTYRRLSTQTDAHTSMQELDADAFETQAREAGWIHGADLAADDDGAFDALRRAAVAFTGEVDAKTIGLAMAWAAGPVLGVPLGAYGSDRRVPQLTLADLAFRPHATGADAGPEAVVVRTVPFDCLPSDPAHKDPQATVVTDEALQRRFVEVVEGLIDPIATALRRRTTIAEAAVWGLAAGTIAYELAEAGVERSGLPTALHDADGVIAAGPRLGRRRPALFVLDAPGEPWFGLKGAVCCRADRWVGREGERCLSCPLRDDESRLEGLRAWRASLVPAGR